MLCESLAVLDAAPQPTSVPSGGGLEQTFIMLLIAMVFFYFIMWRPEKKRRKEMEDKRSAMKKGDHVITAGGIKGEVDRINQDSVVIKLFDGAKMEVLKAAIQDVLGEKKEPEAPKPTT